MLGKCLGKVTDFPRNSLSNIVNIGFRVGLRVARHIFSFSIRARGYILMRTFFEDDAGTLFPIINIFCNKVGLFLYGFVLN